MTGYAIICYGNCLHTLFIVTETNTIYKHFSITYTQRCGTDSQIQLLLRRILEPGRSMINFYVVKDYTTTAF